MQNDKVRQRRLFAAGQVKVVSMPKQFFHVNLGSDKAASVVLLQALSARLTQQYTVTMGACSQLGSICSCWV